MRRQDPQTARRKPQTVADARARDKARERKAELARQAEEDRLKKRKTKRRLIGAGAVVGLVGVVALGYWALSADEVTARCVDDDGDIVAESYCGGTPGPNGIFIIAGSQYRYYYGGSGSVGQKISGGTTVKPKGATIKTTSGSTIQRGGLGSKIGGSSGS
ncbi:hypothetical protein JGU72_01540 [Antrihabitans sp. YC2-6]|nr:hypothetical protein [Antrihabitans sp. YC2-6]